MKIGVLVLVYNVDRFLLPMLENCGPHVDRIYASWSALPWSAYNKNARNEFQNRTSADLLQQSRFRDKITLITGEWPDEALQRNEALDRARKDGMDFLIVQDADEFYTHEDYAANIRFLAKHPEADYFRGKWFVFWKNTQWVLDCLGGQGRLSNNENFAVNCRRPVRFVINRRVDADPRSAPVVPGVCCHLSWVYSDREVWEKISTWGHAHEVSARRWFETKWQGWRPRSRCLSPVRPTAMFWRAVRFDGQLPEALADFHNETAGERPLTLGQRAVELFSDGLDLGRYFLAVLRAKARRVFP